ncbi:MAG: aldo/keto reductase, partial [Actinobacteria bacterium]|nr:aldo/keto reductase [Actinomycetota bacterium]
MADVPAVTLNNGVMMPQIGFGVFRVPEEGTMPAVLSAIEAGYRGIDT